MNKKERQMILRQVILGQKLKTQEELNQALQAEGVQVTQPTISRDMRDLGIRKLQDEDKQSYYALPESIALRSQFQAFERLLKENVLTLDRVEFVLIMRTRIDMANIIAAMIDEGIFSEVLGTTAGADTIAIFCRGVKEAKQLYEILMKMCVC